jgi:hypothetical protein
VTFWPWIISYVACTSGILAPGPSRSVSAQHYPAPLFFRPPPSITPSLIAFSYVAPTLRFSFRAITLVVTFSRASVFSVRTSSFVHGLSFAIVAISPPYALTLAKNHTIIFLFCFRRKVASKKVQSFSVPNPLSRLTSPQRSQGQNQTFNVPSRFTERPTSTRCVRRCPKPPRAGTHEPVHASSSQNEWTSPGQK